MNKYEKALRLLNRMANSRGKLYFKDYGEIEHATKIIKELVERARPIEQIYDNCSECGSAIIYKEDNYCNNCGQALKWSD